MTKQRKSKLKQIQLFKFHLNLIFLIKTRILNLPNNHHRCPQDHNIKDRGNQEEEKKKRNCTNIQP